MCGAGFFRWSVTKITAARIWNGYMAEYRSKWKLFHQKKFIRDGKVCAD
jgi:hypothetical protein